MAITNPIQTYGFFDDATGASVTKTGATSNYTAGSDVVVLLTAYNGTPLEISAVSVTGTALTKAIGTFETGGSSFGQIWYGRNITGGNKNVAITCGDATGTWMQGAVMEFASGSLAATGTVVTTAAVYDNSGIATKTVTTATGAPAIGDLVVGVSTGKGTSTTAGQTEVFNGIALGSGFAQGVGMRKFAIATGNQSLTFNDTNLQNAELIIAVLKASTGGGSNYTLTAGQGSYALGGQNAGLLYARIMAAAQGSYTYTGFAANTNYNTNRTLAALPGSYVVTGSNALVDTGMNAAQGSYTLTGFDANLVYSPLTNRTLVAAQGSYALTGFAANLLENRIVVAAKGQYNLSGGFVNLLWSGAPLVASGAITKQIAMAIRIGL